MTTLVADQRKATKNDKRMPYVNEEVREALERYPRQAANPGELNYQITRLVATYLGTNPNYQRFNDAVGALEAAKLELYRRLIAPYEAQKQFENGDVY